MKADNKNMTTKMALFKVALSVSHLHKAYMAQMMKKNNMFLIIKRFYLTETLLPTLAGKDSIEK